MSNSAVQQRCATGAWLTALGLCTIFGCNRLQESDTGQSASQVLANASLVVGGVSEYNEFLSQHRGDVVLVDFWATWCVPCIKQFPHTVELHREYHGRGLAVLSVSLNEPKEQQQVAEFLTRHDAAFENLLSEYGGGTNAIEAFDLPGPVPCYRIYDRAGKLRHEFSVDPRAERQFTPEDVAAAVQELL